MIEIARPKFTLGKLVATPGALDALTESGQSPMEFVARHIKGDWGDVCDADRRRMKMPYEMEIGCCRLIERRRA